MLGESDKLVWLFQFTLGRVIHECPSFKKILLEMLPAPHRRASSSLSAEPSIAGPLSLLPPLIS
jgi:hypothetical protein